jgi:predicted lysophospholipase L1 biosynthesis ABC-type transport system permease subunit
VPIHDAPTARQLEIDNLTAGHGVQKPSRHRPDAPSRPPWRARQLRCADVRHGNRSSVSDAKRHAQRLFGGVLSWLSALAFALAAIGLHGLVAQSTGERTREFGIRAALGATRADLARLVCRYVALVAVLGAGIGLGLAALSSRLVESMLFGISAVDAGIYVAALVTLVLTVAIAAAAPVVRATRVQPVDVLRAE